MKVERVCDKCSSKFNVNSFNHRTKCFKCLPKATHRYEKPIKTTEEKIEEKKESNEKTK